MMTSTHPLHILLFAVSLSLLPLAFGMMTSFLKVNIVLGMLKNALGVQQAPGVIAEVALAGVITLMVMNPVFTDVLKNAEKQDFSSWQDLKPSVVLKHASDIIQPWRDFLLTHSGKREMQLLLDLEGGVNFNSERTGEAEVQPKSQESRSAKPGVQVLLGSFVLTELREAFLMSFVLLIPFLVIDLIVAHLLTGLGMMMMSPVIVALPIKLILFVVADGWLLLTRSLVLSYG